MQDLRPPQEHQQVDLGDGQAIRSHRDGYIHAPSLQHATAAAVLRSGALSHPDQPSYSVNLNARRSRIARWLVGGVRQGQTLGALLGYRFERALHDAQLDTEIANFRMRYPTPVVAEPPGNAAPDLWARSTEAIAARNVVDGVALARDPGALSAASAANQGVVAPILADVVDALDAVGDLLLAESVHHLVGGNPIRAGLAADTLGRGADLPDTFQTLTTPHRSRALTNRLAVLLPDAPSGPSGWPTDALSTLAPGIEAWVAHLLGPAAGWTVSGKPGDGSPVDRSLDTLGMSALATVLDVSGADPARLRRGFLTAAALPADTAVTFGGPGWAALVGMARRIRPLLAAAQPVLPAHLPGGDTGSFDVTDVRTRLAAFAADPAVSTQPVAAALAAAAAKVIDDPPADTPAEHLERVRAALAADWLLAARSALSAVLGADLPLIPRVSAAVPPARTDASPADLDAWLLRYTRVRDVARGLQETLMLAGARAQRSETLFAAQDPGDGVWIGSVFGADNRPQATTHLVWHQPLAPGPGAVGGLLLDEWVELLPGADQLRLAAGDTPVTAPPESELTGIAFHYDRPDAKAPHCVLLAVPPNLDRGWTPDTLVQVLRETLDLAKLRAIDITDMPRMRGLLPGIRIANDGAAGVVLSGLETTRPGSDPAGPFRLQPDHRTRDRVDTGLAARVHDPLWLLTRQWQFGEFAAQDAGSPAWVKFSGASAPIDAWRPAATTEWQPYQLKTTPLDPVVEAEPVQVDERLRAEGGAHLLRMLDPELRDIAATALADLLLPDTVVDDSAVGLIGAMGGRIPDAAAVAAAIDRGALDPRLGDVAHQWRDWWSAVLADHSPDCFDPHRVEHAAELSVGGTVLRIAVYLADGLEWYSADIDPDTQAAAAGQAHTFTDEEALPSPVRYGGLPADRFWEMEDSEIDLGATDVSALDTGRLLLISFATVYGNDWFLAPLEVPCGSLTVLDRMLIHDVFGRDHLLERAGRDDPTWAMFTLDSPERDHPAASGLLMMPAVQGHTGELLERVGVARDELANLVWAVQHTYTDGRGQRVERRDRWLRAAPPPVPVGALPVYGVQTIVPDYWFPLVPEQIRADAIRFRVATLNAPGITARPEGRLISAGLWLHEEEVPREGISMQRRPVLARWFDGSWHTWIRRQKSPGTGESSSGLAFDTVRPSTPWAD